MVIDDKNGGKLPQLVENRMAGKILAAVVGMAASACALAADPDSADDYSSDLSRVYWGYHQVVTQKEVCDAVVPATRAANEKPFAVWQATHRPLVEDLRRRVTAMIRAASTDEKDYARNLGKYEGEILQLRLEYRESQLKLPAGELRTQCQRMAAVLKSPEADLASVYAIELEAIRKRK